MAELVHEGVTGACFTPGSAADLAATVRRTTENLVCLSRMRMAARRQFETQYSAAASYERLLAIYEHALQERHGRNTPISRGALAPGFETSSNKTVSEYAEVCAP
jgi:hypothetical protein